MLNLRSSGRTAAVALCLSAFVACASTGSQTSAEGALANPPPVKYGRLQVVGGKLCGSDGKPVQLRGMSTAGLQWFGDVVDAKTFVALAKDWKADVVRLALYVGENGYANHPELKYRVWKGIELAIENGLYVIVDWHVLTPGNPNDPVYRESQAFFEQVSRKYGKYPNVLYQIMNEPNGDVSWAEDLKPYADKTVATIRANDPEGIILIGSGLWSQDVDIAARDPVQGKNLAYTFHFYAGSHGEALRKKVTTALELGAAVFASEWGTSEASGNGGPYLPESEQWLSFLDLHKISWINYSLCDKDESSAALKNPAVARKEGLTSVAARGSLLVPETIGPDGYPVWTKDELSASGAFVRTRMRERPTADVAKSGADVSPATAP